jgi:hypothetical protein
MHTNSILQVFDCTEMMQQQQPRQFALPWPNKPSGTSLEASRDPMRRRLQLQRASSTDVSGQTCFVFTLFDLLYACGIQEARRCAYIEYEHTCLMMS